VIHLETHSGIPRERHSDSPKDSRWEILKVRLKVRLRETLMEIPMGSHFRLRMEIQTDFLTETHLVIHSEKQKATHWG